MSYLSARCKLTCAAIAAAFFAQGVAAETIPVRGVYAARVDLPPETQIIVVERFQGDAGVDVELALSNALGNVVIRGEPYFDILSPGAVRSGLVKVEGQAGDPSSAEIQPDATLRGAVRTEVIERQIDPKIERECVARDEDGDCVEREEVRIECREISVRMDARIYLASYDGEQLYSHVAPYTAAERYCADESSVPSVLEMGNDLVEQMVRSIRRDLAPIESSRNIRVMERRRGLVREDRDPFRDAVRATNESIEAACAGFEALEERNPEHVSVLFNIGLCYESGGELGLAADYYSRALSIDPGRDYPSEGLSRVRSRQRAEELLEQRAVS